MKKHHMLLPPFWEKSIVSDRGFGLPELLFIIGIVAVSAYFLNKVFDPYDKYLQMRDATRKDDLKKVQVIVENYYKKYRSYPKSIENKIMGIDWGDFWEQQGVTIPKDPLYPEKWFIYTTNEKASAYAIYASLERGAKDSQVCNNTLDENSHQCDNVPQDTNGSYFSCGAKNEICNYGVASLNSSP